MKSKKPKTKSKLNKDKWNELSKQMREMHPSCELCGATKNLQVHHVFCTKYYAKSILRYHPSNLLVCCPTCHFKSHKSFIQIMVDEIKGV